ncbi:EH_Signature domain-containing protein [Bryocella elongata]|uniref:EH_Signature domain-containing protein n=1 Tax=Bryocella elongata TaxID=863522 RepID=A0A1H6AD34_9BACT|nr:EH signature domain-containing protein [Bryocella elongata]SEG46643.1 EH_Signature domain-containing protein [Bryocella elongata]
MKHLEEAFAQLKVQLTGLAIPALDDIEVRRCLRDLVRFTDAVSKRSPRFHQATGLDPETVWKDWAAVGFRPHALSSREMRTLCGSPLTCLRSQLIAELQARPEPLDRLANFLGIAAAYFRYWRPEHKSMAPPGDIENLIVSRLETRYRESKSPLLVSWRTAVALFSVNGTGWVADRVMRQRSSVAEVVKSAYVEPTSQLAVKSLDLVALRATHALMRTPKVATDAVVGEQAKWLVETVFQDALDPSTLRRCIADLILSDLPDRYSQIRQLLIQVVGRHTKLGDPRLPENGPNWREIPVEAKETLVSWLAAQYIQLFFNLIVPGSDENRRRALFWLKYAARRGSIKDFQVAVSAEDLRKVDGVPAAKGLMWARVSAASNASSAFLMEFHAMGERYIIIEFSETGNAACIYRKTIFESNGATLRRRSFGMSELRDTKRRDDSINHLGAWEHPAAMKLRKIGIVP